MTSEEASDVMYKAHVALDNISKAYSSYKESFYESHGYAVEDAFKFSKAADDKLEAIAAYSGTPSIASDYKEWKLLKYKIKEFISSREKEKIKMSNRLALLNEEMSSIRSRINSLATEEAKKLLIDRLSPLEIESMEIHDAIADLESRLEHGVESAIRCVDADAVNRVQAMRDKILKSMIEEEKEKTRAKLLYLILLVLGLGIPSALHLMFM